MNYYYNYYYYYYYSYYYLQLHRYPQICGIWMRFGTQQGLSDYNSVVSTTGETQGLSQLQLGQLWIKLTHMVMVRCPSI